jgi:aryl-alcohol dehydrogenase
MDLHAQGRFPFHELVQFFEFDQIEEAMAASAAGDVLKPIIRMPRG